MGEQSRKIYIVSRANPVFLKPILKASSLPENYTLTYQYLVSQGMSVMAFGLKILEEASIQREEAEADLIFTGFYVYNESQNKKNIKRMVDLQQSLSFTMFSEKEGYQSLFVMQQLSSAPFLYIDFESEDIKATHHQPNLRKRKNILGLTQRQLRRRVSNSYNSSN